MIDFQSVTVAVADPNGQTKRLLVDISVTLSERRIAIIGPNGSGKSTFLKLINGLVTPNRGSVTVAGHDVARDAAQVRRQVGFVFSDALAQLVMSTPIEDIELSLKRSIKSRAERRGVAQKILDDRGLGHTAHQSIYALSGGERQLVALTSVLAVSPAILIADEPTTLLDLKNRNQVLTQLMSVDQQLIVASHDLDLAAQTERALLIVDGRIAADGAPAEVIQHYRNWVAA